MNKQGYQTVYTKYIKRILDVFCSLAVFMLFWWLYLILILLVKSKLGSPVLFKQNRPGMMDPNDGKERIFKLYKFRTMTDTRDENGELLPDSERLTRFGRLLRRTSLDELPELWNILKGDMSVIGPRPWAVTYLPYYTEEEHRRHLVRPGLSGWAQVNGRTTASWEQRIQSDLEYVDKVSFGFDIKIFFMTIKQVLFGKDIVDTAEEQGNFDDYRRKQWAEHDLSKLG